MNTYVKSFLHSFSQIMLQENAITGLFFIIGIGLNSPQILLGACIATLSGLAFSKLQKYDKQEIEKGLYGYNAALVGCALFFFLKPSALSLSLLVGGAVLSTLIMHLMLKKVRRVLAFTAPFIITTWIILILLRIIDTDISPTSFTGNETNDFYVLLRGIGQVMFQDYWLTGLIFVIGLLFSSIKVTAWIVAASALSIIFARLVNLSEDLIVLGIYSFNASLVVIALNVLYAKTVWPIFIAVIITVLLTKAFVLLHLPALTAPFVISSWLIIALVRPSNLVIKR